MNEPGAKGETHRDTRNRAPTERIPPHISSAWPSGGETDLRQIFFDNFRKYTGFYKSFPG